MKATWIVMQRHLRTLFSIKSARAIVDSVALDKHQRKVADRERVTVRLSCNTKSTSFTVNQLQTERVRKPWLFIPFKVSNDANVTVGKFQVTTLRIAMNNSSCNLVL